MQQLSGNVAKLSGNCGRLKCCLLYEYENYSKVLDKYPPLNSRIETAQGIAKILKVDVFKDTVNLYIPEGQKYLTISYDELQTYVVAGKVHKPADEDLNDDYFNDEIVKLLEDDI